MECFVGSLEKQIFLLSKPNPIKNYEYGIKPQQTQITGSWGTDNTLNSEN